MKVVVFGTGYAGGGIVRELVARGHAVVAVSRSGSAELPASVEQLAGNADDADFVASAIEGADAVVSALASSPDGATLAELVGTLARAAGASGTRLGVVGGGSTIPVHEGEPAEGDTDAFPAKFAPLHIAHLAVGAALEATPDSLDWFVLVPAGAFGSYKPGERTGRYRTSRTAQVVGEDGKSFIGIADYAIAFADELERPSVHRGWFTVGY